MERRLAGMLLAMAGVFFSGQAAADGAVFDTMDHEKAQGIRIQVTYPKGFSAREHMDGYVVQEFTRRSGTLEENLTLQVADMDEDEAKAAFALDGSPGEKERHEYWRRPLALLPAAKVLKIADRVADGRPAVFMAVTMTPAAGDGMHRLRVQTLNIYAGGKNVMLTCSVSGPPSEKAAVDRLYDASANAVCRPFFDSVKLLPEKRAGD